MSEFLKKFLLEDTRRLNSGLGRQIFLGAFGKHPGWDDHVEDLGLETDSLIFAKTILYVNGIGGQIDAGAWEKLEPAQQVPAFNHVFVWQRSGQFLIGRMWSSSDGKGRTRYPMVVCAHCAGVQLGWALDQVLPRLEMMERACRETNSAADVRAMMNKYRHELRSSLTGMMPELEYAPVSAEARERFLARPEFGAQQEGLFRVLYQLKSQTSGFAPGKTDTSGTRPQQIRLPKAADTVQQAVLLWTRFFQLHIDPSAPLLFTIPLTEDWVDATMGEPGSQEMFCLRASPKSVPLASEIPFNLDGSFREKSGRFLTAFKNSSESAPKPSPETDAAPAGGIASVTQRWFKNLTKWGAVFVVAAGLVVWLVILPRKKAGDPSVTQSPPKATAQTAQDNVKTQPPTEKPAVAAMNTGNGGGTGVANATAAIASDAAAAEAKAKAEADAAALEAARLKNEADAKEKARLAEEEKAKQVAEQQRLADEAKAKQLAEEKRLAEEKEKNEMAARAEAASSAVSAVPVKVAMVTETPAVAKEQPVEAPAKPANSHREITNGLGMALVWVDNLPGTKDGGYVGKFEVTQGEYVKVMMSNPSTFTGDPRQPVENVSWNDAMDFCQKLTAMERSGKTLAAGQAYMLPTEEQWNFFLADARFEDGVTSRTTGQKSTADVGSTGKPNKNGLYDVLGNVWEWCLDKPNPDERKLKGGAYNTLKTVSFGTPMTEKTARTLPADARFDETGFRCVLVAMQP